MDTMNEWMDGNLIFTPKNNIIFEQKTVIAFKKIDAINERIIVVVVVITFYVFFVVDIFDYLISCCLKIDSFCFVFSDSSSW